MNRSQPTVIWPSRLAFTLVELLVVISIVAVLIAMVLPAVAAAKSVSQASACMSNLRQVHIGFAAYAGENKEYLPPVGRPTEDACWNTTLGKQGYFGASQQWGGTIGGPTGPRWKVFQCPSEYPNLFGGTSKPTTNFDNDWMRSSYAINDSIIFWNITNLVQRYYTPRRSFYEPKLVTASQAPIVIDARGWLNGWDTPTFAWDTDTYLSTIAVYPYIYRHINQGSSTLFLDGHATQRKRGASPTWVAIW